jgi:hypothetical protein
MMVIVLAWCRRTQIQNALARISGKWKAVSVTADDLKRWWSDVRNEKKIGV